MDYLKDKKKRLRQLISLPIICSLLIPTIILDIWVEFYHRICFPLYGLKTLQRSNYIKVDRHKLKYLSWYQKIGCAYCGYVNGLSRYWSAILAKTEQYWCGIMHKKRKGFVSPEHHKNFVKYDDEKAFKKRYEK